MDNVAKTPVLEKRRAEFLRLASAKLRKDFKLPLLLAALHVPLGIALYNMGSLALIHPIIVTAIGLRRALRTDVKLERVAWIVAYIIGVEVLFRMAQVPVFWEFGKYGAALIMVVALAARSLWTIPSFAVFYIVLLLPSTFLLVAQDGLESQGTISSIMSGPLLLFVSCWFFSHLKVGKLETRRLLVAMILPLISVAVATLFYTVTASEITFGGESNFATSGGFGPNQVSAMLGLGAFLCIACLLLFKNAFGYTVFFAVLGLLFTAQSVLTFSRGGMYNAVGAILLVIIFQIRNFNEGIRRLLPVAAVTALFLVVVFPFMDNFTGGALKERFEDSDPTRRGTIIEADLQIFAANPVFGVGVGNGYNERRKYMDTAAMSHTEFARLISEHGSFGLLAIAAIILMIVANFSRQKTVFGRALVVGLVAWSCFFMLNTGMRLAAPSVILGMTYMIVAGPRMPGFLRRRRQMNPAAA